MLGRGFRRLTPLCAAMVIATVGAGAVGAGWAGAVPREWLPSSGCVNDLPPKPVQRPFDPRDLIPKLPDHIGIPLPYPRILPVPEPAPAVPQVRIPSQLPPRDPCSDPCPDITDPPKPKPGGPALSIEFPKITLDPVSYTHLTLPTSDLA